MAILKPQTPLTPEQQLQRRRNLGVGLAALSETLRGGDPVARTLGLMEQFEQQEEEIKTQQQQEEQNKLLDEAIKQSPNITEARKNYLFSLPYEQKTSAFLKFAQPNEQKLTASIQDFEYFSGLDDAERLEFMQASGSGA